MEQVYSSTPPDFVQFGQNKAGAIGLAVMLLAIPVLIVAKWHRRRAVFIFLLIQEIILIPLVIGFFTDYWGYVQKCAARYDVEGTNNTLAYSTTNTTCIKAIGQNVINSTCFVQNILSSITYNDRIYVYGNFTNTYNIQPDPPAIEFPQNFMPWAPTVRNYDRNSTSVGDLGDGLLMAAGFIYGFQWFWLFAIICKCDEACAEQQKINDYIKSRERADRAAILRRIEAEEKGRPQVRPKKEQPHITLAPRDNPPEYSPNYADLLSQNDSTDV